jgi:glycosyltransferase involved in cell wall biosynthesis
VFSLGHSYAVGLNRRLPHEMARAAGGRWEVVAAAPSFVHGDMRPIPLEAFPGEACRLEKVRAYLTSRPHLLAYGRRLRSLLRERWDIVHCWEEPYVLAGFQVSRWAENRRVVFYTHQNLDKWYPPPFGWFEKTAIQCSAGWIAGGHTVRDTLASRTVYANRPHEVIPLGVDLDVFHPDGKAGAAVRLKLGWEQPGPPVVGYLGRFIPEKGVRLLMRSLEAIASPWRALFVGAGPLEAELRAWAERFPDRVRVVTGVPHNEVPSYLNAMDVLAAPSQTTPRWREQLGRMLIEGFSCGIPVVGSDSGEIPFVLGDAGRVVQEADGASWTATLGELLESPRIRAELATRGQERARSRFAWPVIARQHLAFFEQLVQQRPTRG